MNNFGEKVAFIWSVADLLRDAFKRSKYPDVMLPLTVLRRLDCVVEVCRGDFHRPTDSTTRSFHFDGGRGTTENT